MVKAPRLVLVVLCLLSALFASEALAVKRYLAPAPVGNDNNLGTLDSPWATFSKALTSANSLDTVIAARGAYTDDIAPTKQFGFVGVTVIGDSVTPNTTSVTGINISATAGNRVFSGWNIIGFRVNGNVSVSENEGLTNVEADGFNLRHLRVRGNLTLVDVDGNLSYVSVGFGPDTASSATRIYGEGEGIRQNWDHCSFEASPSPYTSYTDYAIQMEAKLWQNFAFTVDAANCGLRIYGPGQWLRSVPGGGKPSFLRGWKNCNFTDCRFDMVDSTGSDTSMAQGWLWRDRMEFNKMVRCTVTAKTVTPGHGAAIIQAPGSGSGAQGQGNVWRFCWFQSNLPLISSAGGTVGYVWQIQPNDSFYRNVVVCSTGTSRAGFVVNNVQGNGYIGNNTFYNRGTGGAFMVNDDGSDCAYMTGTLTVENNIFYSRSTGTSSSDYAAGVQWKIGRYFSDYNLYAHYGSSTGLRSLKGAPCNGSAAGTATYYSPATLYSQWGLDQHSVYGSPRFVGDTLFANFDADILPTSAAKCAGRDGVTIGAMDADCVRPFAIEDLNAAYASPVAVSVSWTATGDDSLTGSCATYDLRYSTNPIDESNWSSATVVTGEPTPSLVGERDSKTVTGLSAGTRYYFAIKARDEYENESVLGQIASIITPLTGPDIADP